MTANKVQSGAANSFLQRNKVSTTLRTGNGLSPALSVLVRPAS
jgi:hypothetical protein